MDIGDLLNPTDTAMQTDNTVKENKTPQKPQNKDYDFEFLDGLGKDTPIKEVPVPVVDTNKNNTVATPDYDFNFEPVDHVPAQLVPAPQFDLEIFDDKPFEPGI